MKLSILIQEYFDLCIRHANLHEFSHGSTKGAANNIPGFDTALRAFSLIKYRRQNKNSEFSQLIYAFHSKSSENLDSAA